MTLNLKTWANTAQDRNFRNDTNENWDKIQRTYNSLEADNTNVKQDVYDTKNQVERALKKSEEANTISKSVQEQIDEIVVKGDSSVEAAQARVDADGKTFGSLKERIDAEQSKVQTLIETTKQTVNANTSLIIPTYEGSNQTVHPKVVYFPGGWNGWKYWMAHTPYPASNDIYENPSISVSNNGIEWKDPQGITNPIDQPTSSEIADKYHMSDTHLLFVNGYLECWYRFNKNGVIDQIFRKRTTDGINWSDREVMYTLTGNDMVLSPAVVFDENKYKMWYVTGSYEVKYAESTDGKTWSSPTIVAITTIGEKPYRHWHLDVIKDNGKYEILIASGDANLPFARDRKSLLYGTSTSPTNFTVIEIMSPSDAESGKWDSYMLYRSSLTKIGSLYRIYYSAMSVDNTWHIGLSQGEDIYSLRGFQLDVNSYGDLTSVNDVKPIRDVVVNEGKKYYTTPNRISYVDNKEIKLVIPGVAGLKMNVNDKGFLEIKNDRGDTFNDLIARILNATSVKVDTIDLGDSNLIKKNDIKLVNPGVSGVHIKTEKQDTVSVKNDAGTLLGNFEAQKIYANNINPTSNITDGFMAVNCGLRINGDSLTARMKFVIPGVKGVGIGVGNNINAVRVFNDAGTATGHMEVASVIFDSSLSAPAVEGAIRYNPNTKKHEGYNGSSWNPLY